MVFSLDEGKVQEAIKASQLCLRLLETSVKEELRRLLIFMTTAAQPEACRLQKQVNTCISVLILSAGSVWLSHGQSHIPFRLTTGP